MLKPVAMFWVLLSVFTFVFSNQPDYTIRLVLGLFLYDYFQESTKAGLVSLHAKGYLIGRSRFPRWLLVLASTANPLLVIATASLAIVTYLAWIGRAPGPLAIALYGLYVFLFAMIVIGFSLATSVLFVATAI
jgi:ABC-2 type transport system permease protein